MKTTSVALTQTTKNKPGLAHKLKRDFQSTSETLQAKPTQVMFMLENRLAASRVQNTIQGAHKVLASLSSQNTTEGLDELVSCGTLMKHQLLLDGAVDRCTAEYLMTQREEG